MTPRARSLGRYAVSLAGALATAASLATTDAGEDSDGGSWLVVPVVVTEPAIGEGLGAAVVYFHSGDSGDQQRVTSVNRISKTGKQTKPPPTATGLFLARTNNGTEAFGLGHSRTTAGDRYRIAAFMAEADVSTTYFVADVPIEFQLEGSAGYAAVKRRIGDSNWFVGGAASVIDASVDFAGGNPPSQRLITPNVSFSDVGVALLAVHDERDNTMMPESGHLYDVSVTAYDDAIGGDFDYWRARLKGNWFYPYGERVVVGLRLDGSVAGGDIPFYAQPYVPLRGIPALRYQGDWAGVAETEVRYRFARRWSVLGFAGRGFVDDSDDAASNDTIEAYGLGLRWLANEKADVWIGIDVASGPDDDHWYLQMTHPW